MTARWSELMQSLAARAADRPVYHFLPKGEAEAITLSYGDLLAQAGSLALHLRARYAPGTHLMLLFEPGLDFCRAFWACLLAGMVAVPCYPPADPRLRERFFSLAKDAGAKGVLTTAAIRRLITLARWLVSSLRRLDWLAIDELPLLQGDLPAPASPQQLALLQYTSGSTGTPRGVMLSHGNLWHNLGCLDAARRYDADRPGDADSLVSWLPLYHDMGLMAGVVFPVYLGTFSVLFSPLHFLQKPVRWLRAISTYRASLSAAPNFAYEFCLRRIRDPQLEGIDLSSWSVTLNGAEMIRPATLSEFNRRFAAQGLKPEVLYPCYGLAESTVFVTGNRRGSPARVRRISRQALLEHRVVDAEDDEDSLEIVSAGETYGDTVLRIVDPETCQPLAADRVGEIWLRGSSVGQGYWQQPEASRATFGARIGGEGSWLRTGDLGFCLDGWLYVTGRIKDLIILQGQNHAPQTFEALCEQAHPDIRPGCVAAFGAGDPEGLVILAEIRPESRTPAGELQQVIRAAVGEQAGVPIQELMLVVKGSLPKTSSGKLRRSAARELYLAGKLRRWKG